MDAYQANKIIKEIEDAAKRRDEFKAVAKQEMYELKMRTEEAERRYESETSEQLMKLTEFLLNSAYKETPTQKSLHLPYGKLVYKMEKQEIEKGEEEELLRWAKDNASDYVKTKETVAYGELKKDCVINDGVIIRESTGEVVEGLKIKDVPASFDVKF